MQQEYIVKDPFKTEEYMINMGPQHPATHGVLRLVLTIDGEIIKKVEPDLGYIHRSIEKCVSMILTNKSCISPIEWIICLHISTMKRFV